LSKSVRGKPEIDFESWKDARGAVAVCPTGALSCIDTATVRTASLDLAKCTFCGLCAEVDTAIRVTRQFEIAARTRAELLSVAKYRLNSDGTHADLAELPTCGNRRIATATQDGRSVDALGARLKERIRSVLGRSLHIREVDAGSCNGCEVEIAGLNSPVYDIERFGVHFVASPRHADMLLVTGPVSRNMELALRKTYEAMPAPRLVVAVGACGCSGGIFGVNYASLGGVDNVLPVDVFIPGCPPNPFALIHGILNALGKFPKVPAIRTQNHGFPG
jgi:Ni,Fe-hydrogenase III small subunit